MKRGIAVVAVAVGFVGCGAGKTTTVTRTQTAAPATPAAPAAPPVAQLAPSEKARLNRGIASFNANAKAHDGGAAQSDASAVAAVLTELAAKHIGTPLSRQLVAASDDWIAVSTAILQNDQAALNQAEQNANRDDRQIHAGG